MREEKLPEKLWILDQKRIDDPRGAIQELGDLIPELENRELGLALGIYGSCLRQRGQIRKALKVIKTGLEKVDQEWDRAHLLQRLSIAVSATGNFDRAFEESNKALIGYLRSGDSDGIGRVTTNQAAWWFHQKSYRQCINANQIALNLLSQDNLQSRFTCHQGTALAYLEVSEKDSCLLHLKSARELAASLGAFSHAKFLWLEAKICERAGCLEAAELALRAARRVFLGQGENLEAALASIALIENLMIQGKSDEALEEGIDCRRFVLLLPEQSAAYSILASIWQRAEQRALSQHFLQSAINKLESGRTSAPVMTD